MDLGSESVQTRRVSGRLLLLCGRSFSGKTTLARVLADALPAVVVSLDAINDERGLHGGDGIPVEEWARHPRHRSRARGRSAAGRLHGSR